MKNDNSIEGNKLIAEFCGYKYHRKVLVDNSECGGIYDEMDIWSKREILVNDFGDQVYFSDDWYKSGGYKESIYGELKYHTSWDWLMPCLRKFNDLNIHDRKIREEWLTVIGKTGSKTGKRYVALCDNIDDAVTRDYNIIHAWQSLVEAIQWYNQTKIKTNEQ